MKIFLFRLSRLMSVGTFIVCLLNVPHSQIDMNINDVFLMTVSLLSVLVTVAFHVLENFPYGKTVVDDY